MNFFDMITMINQSTMLRNILHSVIVHTMASSSESTHNVVRLSVCGHEDKRTKERLCGALDTSLNHYTICAYGMTGCTDMGYLSIVSEHDFWVDLNVKCRVSF